MKLTQGSTKVTLVTSNTRNFEFVKIGTAKYGGRQRYWVETPLIEKFFIGSHPGNIMVDGTALLQFSRRRLRSLEEIAGQGEFTVDVPFDPTSGTPTKTAPLFAVLVASFLAALI